MATELPNLTGGDFEEKVEKAIKKSVSLLRSKCVDNKMYRSEFEMEVNTIFREFGLMPEEKEYDSIELELNNLDCYINESFLTFDKFILNQ